MSFFQWFSRRSHPQQKSASTSSECTSPIDPLSSNDSPHHLKYSSFRSDPRASSNGVPSFFDSPVTPSDQFISEDDDNTSTATFDGYTSTLPSTSVYDASNEQQVANGHRQFLLQRYLTTTASNHSSSAPSFHSIGAPSTKKRYSKVSASVMASTTSLSMTSLTSMDPTSYNSLNEDDNSHASTGAHLQSYPGERLPRESYIQLNSDAGTESGELHRHSRGSSVLAGISVVTNTIIGVALLGVPWAYAGIGLPLGVALTFCFACLAIFAMYLLSSLAITYGNADESFYSLARKAFPDRPTVRFVVDSLVLVKAVGVGCSYLVVVGDMLPEVVGGSPEWLGESLFRSLSIVMAVVLFVLPASLPKRIRSLRFTNYISLMCLVYVTCLIVFASESLVLKPDDDKPGRLNTTNIYPTIAPLPFNMPHQLIDHPNSFPSLDDSSVQRPTRRLMALVDAGSKDESFFVTTAKTLPVFVFMFSCAQNLLSITNELKTRTLSKSLNVITCSVFCALTVYLLVGVSGSLALGADVAPDVLNCFDSGNIFVWIAKTLVVISVIFSFPLQCHPFRRSLWVLTASRRPDTQVLSLRDARQAERQFLHQTTLLFIIITTGLALAVHDLGLVFQIVGVLGSTTMSYLMPPIIYLKLTNNEPWDIMRFGAACLVIGSSCLIPTSLYAIIVSRL